MSAGRNTGLSDCELSAEGYATVSVQAIIITGLLQSEKWGANIKTGELIVMKEGRILSGGLLAAFLSSLCCITPVLAMIAGTGSIAASFSWVEPVRPYLAGVTIAVLGFAWYQKLFPNNTSQECACEPDSKVSFWRTKSFLSIITVFAFATLSFPHYAHVFYPHNEKQVVVVNKETIKTVEFKISGMTCQGCAEHVMYEVNKLDGVLTSDVSYKKANAVIEFDEQVTRVKDIENAINRTGYKVVETTQ
jgi:mercuric ion transport protein